MISALVLAAAAAASQQFVLEEHPTLRVSEQTFVLARMRWDYEHRAPAAEWDFVRRRFSIEGGIGGRVAFEVEVDLEGDERWKDVYAEYTAGPALTVRAGKFVLPFGYERTTSLDVLDFAYRAMASSTLVPPRDQGVMAFGGIRGGRVRYDAGIFEEGRTMAGRIVARAGGGFEIGASGTYGSLDGESARLRGQTALGVPFFRAARAPSGRRRRASVHAVYRAGPAALKAEYLGARDRDDVRGMALDGSGWYASASLVLTGESEADAHHPARPLFGGGAGSIEVAARIERLAFGRGASARAFTLGANWQPVRFFRVQLNAVRDVVPSGRWWSRVLRFHLTI